MADPLHTFRVVSFGCKVNQTEGRTLAERLRALGLCEVGPRSPADLVLVNTCCVTAEAARQGRQRARKALRRAATVAVTGCAAHPASGDADLRALAGLVALDADKDRLLARLRQTGRLPDAPATVAADATPAGPRPAPPHRSRAMLKVQDGCPGGCAYCIVPKVRPHVWSVPVDDAVRQAQALVAEGFREIVLCGIHLGLYGADLPDRPTLAGLIEHLLAVDGLGRLRLSSLSPAAVTGALVALLAAEPDRLCPHVHLSLQSGDDAVLKAMGRPYTSRQFLDTVERIRAAADEPAITTDVLVGFPGETDAAFEATLRVAREARFSRMHVFPFSRRPGTRAADMPDRVPNPVKQERRRRVADLGATLAEAYRRRLVGRAERAIVETVLADGSAKGLAARYVRVAVRGPLPPGIGRRNLVPVRLVRAAPGALEAQPRP